MIAAAGVSLAVLIALVPHAAGWMLALMLLIGWPRLSFPLP